MFKRAKSGKFVKKVKSTKKSKTLKGARKRKHHFLPSFPSNTCDKCGRVIFGGDKGLATHKRKNH